MKHFRVMEARNWADERLDVLYPVIVQRKYDGVRMIATKDGLFSKNGRRIVVCGHIAEELSGFFEMWPDAVLDGELVGEDIPFEGLLSLVGLIAPDSFQLARARQELRYVVFDGALEPADFLRGYRKRFADLRGEVSARNVVVLIGGGFAGSEDEVVADYSAAVACGHEGIVIRDPRAPYEHKRSDALLKLKPFDEAEFEVVEMLPNSIRLRTPGGMEFGAVLSAVTAGKVDDPAFGCFATVKFQGYTASGVPRFPVCKAIAPFDR